MNTLHVDLDLVKRYSVPGPRYTSYPPATQFRELEAAKAGGDAGAPRETANDAPAKAGTTNGLGLEPVIEGIRANNKTAGDLSLYFHLPFCHSLCWYCGCTTVITTQRSKSGIYLKYLQKELDLMASLLHPERKAVQIHFGGGTPTFLTPDEIRTLGRMIRDRFNVAPDVEAGVEIDPRRLTNNHVLALRDVGFNRASIGVQDHNPIVQEAVHRIQPFEQTKQVVEWIRKAGFQSVNIDLIYGLPHQTPASFEKTLNEILLLNPDRFAVFNYAHVPWIKPAQRIFKEEALPSADTKLQILKLTIEKLTAEGYVYIGMDHFARADDELAQAQRNKTLQRNFQGYSTRSGADIYAFGMSSISQADGIYWQNEKELPAYYGALDEGRLPITKGYVLTTEDKLRRQVIMRLMCDLGLDFGAMSRTLGVDFTTHFQSELKSLADMEADGLVERSATGLRVTELGRLLIRNIAMRFDAYLPAEKERRFSRTI
jgi:oxygen-independent coproporphyrinogen-3 oxidase